MNSSHFSLMPGCGHSTIFLADSEIPCSSILTIFNNEQESKTVETTKTKPQMFPKYGNIMLKARHKKIVNEGTKLEERCPK